MKFKTSILTSFFTMLLLTACGAASQPTLPLPPTVQVKLPPEPIIPPASPTAATRIIWSTYHHSQYGFTFEYPTVYDDPSYKDTCGIQENSNGIHLGHQIDLLFLESNGLDLTAYANNLVQTRGWTSDSLKNVTINGAEAVTVEYRFGGANRFGTFTLLEHNSRVFVFNLSAGSFCDIPEANVSETEVYSHLLETFQPNP